MGLHELPPKIAFRPLKRCNFAFKKPRAQGVPKFLALQLGLCCVQFQAERQVWELRRLAWEEHAYCTRSRHRIEILQSGPKTAPCNRDRISVVHATNYSYGGHVVVRELGDLAGAVEPWL